MEEEAHAKLTGAGGGGCVLVFPKNPISECSKLFGQLEAQGFTVHKDVQIETEGLIFN